MIVEILEFLRMLETGEIYWLPFHLLIFIVLSLSLRDFLANRHKPSIYADEDPPVSVIIPTYKENPDILRNCVRAAANDKPEEIIIIHDDGLDSVERIGREFGATVISFPKRVGKRKAMVEGWKRAKYDIIVHLDGDEIVENGCLGELVKPLQDAKVVGVGGRSVAYLNTHPNGLGSWIAWRLSILQEINRGFTCKALRPHLVNIDGRVNAWRRSFLLKHEKDFLNDMFMGKRSDIGDDRYLTQAANLEGWNTTYQESAIAGTASPASFKDYVKQQLRWTRSGYKFFYLDIKRGLRNVTWFYYLSQVFFYGAAVSFLFAIIHDTFLIPPVYGLSLGTLPVVMFLGSSLVAVIGMLFAGRRQVKLREFLCFGLIGVLVMFPTTLYAMFTVRKQSTWGTR